ncbi:MAG: hypothetical protein F4053_04190 [Proteobacteria bacterium]|nr:hypothetical protein [Pseudomonadota bacterium]
MAKDSFSFTVNDTEIRTQHDKLIAADILKLAEEAGAFPNKSEDYFLETADEKHRFKNEDWVNFHEYKEFITVPTGKTDVAADEQ